MADCELVKQKDIHNIFSVTNHPQIKEQETQNKGPTAKPGWGARNTLFSN
jgi:hypothetical protein